MARRVRDPVSEMRQHPFSGEWIIYAENRFGKPNDFSADPSEPSGKHCPFCLGNEEDTPPAIQVYSESNNGKPWQARVVPNRYPAVAEHAETSYQANSLLGSSRDAGGSHEVIVESPRHVPGLADLDDDEVTIGLRAYRDRLAFHRSSQKWAYAQIFKNTGPSAGASLSHTHAQLITLPFCPPRVQQHESACERYFEENQNCLVCDLVVSEANESERVVAETANYLAYCPYASRFPFEVWIAPRMHATHFDETSDESCAEVAKLLRNAACQIQKACSDISLNVIIQTTSFSHGQAAALHWHIELFPRLTRQAGFEWGTGCWINPVSPETAATQLRDA